MPEIVHDIDRPDVNGTPARMAPLVAIFEPIKALVPVCTVHADDNIMSGLSIRGSFDKREDWANGILQNSRYFVIEISPSMGRRYYSEGQPVTVSLLSNGCPIKLRKYTGPVEKVASKIASWVSDNWTAIDAKGGR